MLEIVLSNTTTFFSGRMESVFKKAKKHGIKYLEILPYRWTKVNEVLALEKKYGIEVAGIHLPIWWHKPQKHQTRTIFGRLFTLIQKIYMGDGVNSPGLLLAEALRARSPYLIVHADIIPEMGPEFETLVKKFNVVVENVPKEENDPEYFWSITELRKKAPIVFDHGHYGSPPELEKAYKQAQPYVFHISYIHPLPFMHDLPNIQEQKTMLKLFAIHAPKFAVLEVFPWINLKKGVNLLREMILHPPRQIFGVETELPSVGVVRN